MSDSPQTAELLVQLSGAVLWLTINREQRRNAMSHAVLAGIGHEPHGPLAQWRGQ